MPFPEPQITNGAPRQPVVAANPNLGLRMFGEGSLCGALIRHRRDDVLVLAGPSRALSLACGRERLVIDPDVRAVRARRRVGRGAPGLDRNSRRSVEKPFRDMVAVSRQSDASR